VFHLVNVYDYLYRLLNPGWHSLRHTLLQRHSGIEHLLHASQLPQVIEIAAGFSPRGSAFSADAALRYFEVDLPAVIAAKRARLAASPTGLRVLGRANLTLLEADATAMDWTQFPECRSFVITEGLMMYFERAVQLRIWRSVASFLSRSGGEYVFDYLPISDEPPRSMAGKLLSRWRGSPKRGFAYDDRTREDVAKDLHDCGFNAVEVFASQEFARAWRLPCPRANTRVLLYRCRCE
jgi:O-methyltransferase involved in polyketide biosynthesis